MRIAFIELVEHNELIVRSLPHFEEHARIAPAGVVSVYSPLVLVFYQLASLTMRKNVRVARELRVDEALCCFKATMKGLLFSIDPTVLAFKPRFLAV